MHFHPFCTHLKIHLPLRAHDPETLRCVVVVEQSENDAGEIADARISIWDPARNIMHMDKKLPLFSPEILREFLAGEDRVRN